MEPFRFHMFVCTQQKPEGGASCPASGSLAVLAALDREMQARGINADVQITRLFAVFHDSRRENSAGSFAP